MIVTGDIKVTETRTASCVHETGTGEYIDWLAGIHSEGWVLLTVHPCGMGIHIFGRLKVE